jgi:hypothetical protein
MVKHTGDKMCDGRNHFAAAGRREFGENGGGNLTTDISESVSVEKEKWRAPMAVPEKFQSLVEGKD